MARREYICGGLLSLLLLPLVESVVTIEIHIKQFESDGNDYRGTRCEAFGRSGCDPYFLICVDKPDGKFEKLWEPDMSSCTYYRNQSAVLKNTGRVTYFEDNIGGIPLPIKINIPEWQGGFLLKIGITDKDTGSLIPNADDIIDLIEKKFTFADDPATNMVRSVTIDDRFSGYRTTNFISATSSVYCPQNFYHTQTEICQQYCKPTDDPTGHYNCSNTGAKICLDGWEDLSSHCTKSIDYCANHNCSSKSECVDEMNGYTCKCFSGWMGRYCDISIDDCDRHNCSKQSTCANGTNGFICQCFPGWAGTYCTTKINVCASNPCGGDEICGINATTGERFCLGTDGNVRPVESRTVGTFISNNLSLIAGLIAGLVFLILIIILLLAFLLSRRRKKKNNQSTNTAVETTNTEMQVSSLPTSAHTPDDGIGPFGNPLYLANGNQAAPNHYSDVDYSRMKTPLPYKQPFDDYPIKPKNPDVTDYPMMHSNKAMEAGFVPEREPEPVKKRLPAGAVPLYVNQAGHIPRYENNYGNLGGNYTQNIRAAEGGAPAGAMKDGFCPMYASGMNYKSAGQFDNPAYDSTLDPHKVDGKFGGKKGSMYNNDDIILEPKL